jgi:hypothetical protein
MVAFVPEHRGFGVAVGYGLSYALFTAILFSILVFLRGHAATHKLLLIVVAITASVALLGALVRKVLA